MAADDRTMFEIYRESDYNRSYHYIFYTDLDEHAREAEIARAANGETVFTGYLHDATKERARQVIETIVDELNDGDEGDVPSTEAIHSKLSDFLAPMP
jgi:HD superfamily phosphohydrolase YqeK